MKIIKIQGENKLNGKVRISGAKNSAVALIPAALLCDEVVKFSNVPNISDIDVIKDIILDLKGSFRRKDDGFVYIASNEMINKEIPEKLATKLRASYYFMGALLGKYKRAEIYLPGGCVIGERPIDLHLKGFEKLGAKVVFNKNKVIITAKKLKGAKSTQIFYKSDLTHINFREKTSQKYKSVQVSYFDPKKKKTVKATAKNDSVVKGDTLKINVRCSNRKDAIVKAKAALGTADTKIEGSLDFVGNPYLIAGTNIEIKSVGHFSGKYHITQARHVIDKMSGYKTLCEVVSC